MESSRIYCYGPTKQRFGTNVVTRGLNRALFSRFAHPLTTRWPTLSEAEMPGLPLCTRMEELQRLREPGL